MSKSVVILLTMIITPLPNKFYQRPIVYCQPEPACGSPDAPGGCVAASALSDAAGIVSVGENAGGLSGLVFTTAECSDCTLKGGTTTKPPFW
ncbi:MAG: hypothetical protein WDO15_11875 [Bacteroidota bacterium]